LGRGVLVQALQFPLQDPQNQRLTAVVTAVRRVGSGLAKEEWWMRRNAMLDSVRKHVAVPDVPVKVLLSVGSLVSFGWLLSHDLVHPIVIYALQLFLSF
jgi:hypothetical protein